MTADADASSAGDAKRAQRAAGWFALAAFLVGAWLRCHHFDRPGLWIDEYGTWWVVAADSWAGVAARAWEVQGQSPLYYLIARAFTDALGLSSWALRLPSLLFGIALLALGHRLARELFRDPRVAAMTVVALALHAPLIRYAQEARPYALALALSVASFVCFVRMLREPSPGLRAGYALTAAGAFYAHYLFGFSLAVQAAYALLRRRELRRPDFAALGAGALLCGPGALQLANLFARRRSLDWSPDRDDALGAALTVVREMFALMPLGISFALVAALLLLGARAWRPATTDRPGLVALWLALPLGLVALLPALIDVHLMHIRYLLVCAPAAGIAVGAVLAVPRGRGLLDYAPVAAFAAASFALVLWPYYIATGTFADRKDQRWGAAVEALLARHRSGDRVLLSTRFVEMDALVAGVAPDPIREFATWPLIAHLPRSADLAFSPLPYRVDDTTRPALDETLRSAFAAPRVWVLGAGPSVDYIERVVARNRGLRVTHDERFGTVELLAIER